MKVIKILYVIYQILVRTHPIFHPPNLVKNEGFAALSGRFIIS